MSIVLHGAWLPQEQYFFVWGESGNAAPRKGRLPKLPPHPFAADDATLRERLSGVLFDVAATPAATRTLWLPSVGQQPLPSPELLAAGATPVEGAPTLAAWQTTGLLLTASQTLDLLLALGNDAGADLRAWRVGALLALEVLAGQQVLPGLKRQGTELYAAWQLDPAPVTAHNIAALARALPPLCRAVVPEQTQALAPRALLDDFLAALVESAIVELADVPVPTAPATPGGKWLAALLGDEPRVQLTGRAADELWDAWQAWAAQGQVAGDNVFRVAFRLEPPALDDAPWALRYLLQAKDDPSLLVPAAEIWREKGTMLRYLDRRFAQPQERLLRALGFAARLFPPIEASLRAKAPEHADLNAEQSFAFLKEAAPLLDQSGFGVLLPSWWGSSGRLRAKAKAAACSTS
jgi:hypothetical protein